MCTTCFAQHQQGEKKTRHIKMPILLEDASQSDLEHLSKIKNAESVIEALLNSLEDVKDTQERAIDALNEIVREVQKYKLELLQELNQHIKVLETRVNEAVQTLVAYSQGAVCAQESEVVSLAKAGLTKERLKAETQILTLSQEKGDLTSDIRKRFGYTIDQHLFLSPIEEILVSAFPYYEEQKLHLALDPFDFSIETSTDGMPFLAAFSAWCLLSNGNAFFTGTTNSKTTVVFDISGSFAIPMPDTLDVHLSPGLIRCRNMVYLFGGLKGENSKTSEVFDVLENRWSFLPNMMVARSHFQPSLHEGFIYLFGGLRVDRCERFCISTYTYDILQLQIPGSHYNISYCHEGKFLIFTQMNLYEWNLNSPRLNKVKEGLNLVCYSQMAPVRVADSIFFFSRMDQERYLMKLDLESLRLDISVTFGQKFND